jgi:GntR family transcriptional regulator
MSIASKPLYRQVRDALADLIARGAWKPGFQIPGETELAREVGVSSGTVRKALELMESQRLIVRRQGRGSFVANPDLEELASRYIRLFGSEGGRVPNRPATAVTIERCAANSCECTRLHLQAGADVYRIRRVREHLGASFLLEDAVLPAALFDGQLSEADATQEIGILAHRHGLLLGKAEERITVRQPPHDIADLLRLPREKPIMRLERVVRILEGRPVEWRVGYLNVARNYYYMAAMK